MIDALAMGKYGVYVWSSYALFAAFLLWDWLLPRLRQARLLRDIAARQQREAARQQRASTKTTNATTSTTTSTTPSSESES